MKLRCTDSCLRVDRLPFAVCFRDCTNSGYFIITVGFGITTGIRDRVQISALLRASSNLHRRMLSSILRTHTRFFCER